jgi:CheY-like chemotaxis protein
VALVLAIDPDHRHEQAVRRLKRELAGHEVVVAGSSDEALDVIEQSVPDLVIFPIVLSSSDQDALTSRLQGLSGPDRVQTLTIPLLASESSDGASLSTAPLRWFYWFRPTDIQGDAPGAAPRMWATEIRAYLQRGRQTHPFMPPVPPSAESSPAVPAKVPSDVGRPHGHGGPQDQKHGDSSHRAVEVSAPKERELFAFATTSTAASQDGADDTRSDKAALFTKAVAAIRGTPSRIVRTVINFGAGAARRVAEAVGRVTKWVGALRVPGTRRLWYVTPALVLCVGGGLAVGIPHAKTWLTAEVTMGVAALESVPEGSEVFLDGKKIGVTPTSTRLPAGKYSVDFRYAGVSKTETLEITPGKRAEIRVDWQRPPAGRLTIRSEPPGAAITVDGTKRGFTPLTLEDVAPGQHLVALKHANGLVQRTVRIKANETETLDVTIYSGWLALFAPIELQITENGRVLRLNEQNQVMLSPGRHDLQLTNAALGFRESQIVEVKPGEVTAVSITIPKTPVTINATPSADVWLDGVKIGETPLADFPVAVGTREFVIKHPLHGERRVMATVTAAPSTIDVDLTKPAP